MRITLESTDDVTTFKRGESSCPVRLWRGETADGTPVVAYVAAVSPQTHDAAANAAFERELVELQRDTRPRPIDLRFVL